MIRDTRKDSDYFKKYLEYQNKRIDDFRKKAETVHEDFQTKKLYLYISGFLRDKLYASYSNGNDINELKAIYEEWLNACEKASDVCYSDLIDIASLCVLLKPDERSSSIVSLLIEAHGESDGLLKTFQSYLSGEDFGVSDNALKYEAYDGLQKAIQATDKVQQTKLLRDYVCNVWYEVNHDSAWHNSHLGKQDTYVGYWCFVSAAIVKIFELDAGLFKDIEFYPTDLM